jgi:hypothetical protein
MSLLGQALSYSKSFDLFGRNLGRPDCVRLVA